MLIDEGGSPRVGKKLSMECDILVVGGGLAGVTAALAAARNGSNVVLLQDRPVLGGNASSEVRLWILGATSHMGNNNRWAREGGIVDELLTENMFRNKEGNPLILDTILLEKVTEEKNIRLLLNTALYEVQMKEDGLIDGATAFCSQNQTTYSIRATQFIDASGDGVLGFLAGAAFRMGAEAREEFDEKFAPAKAYGELLGHSIYFYTKDTGVPVTYKAPSFALKDITAIPRYRSFNAKEFGCKLWWIEYGGRLDTIYDSETIKWELWKVVYGVWDHIKNSGQFPEAATLTLEWVGTIPGKRESRRFEGDYILSQKDIIEQRPHTDQIAFGGWSIDLHPADGVYSPLPGCNQWHSKGIYPIPYRCVYSRNIRNLFLAGRIISASHVAFASTRVMATGAAIGQAVGTAASICVQQGKMPRDLGHGSSLAELQQQLLCNGVFLPGIKRSPAADLLPSAHIKASSALSFQGFEHHGEWMKLRHSMAQMIPFRKGRVSSLSFLVKAHSDTSLHIQFRISHKKENATPEIVLSEKVIQLTAGEHTVVVQPEDLPQQDQYVYLVLLRNEQVEIPVSDTRITGILSLFNQHNPAVSNFGKQEPREDIGVDSFEFWCPKRRPEGKNLAFQLDQPQPVFGTENLCNGIDRPYILPNAWVADPLDPSPQLEIRWEEQQQIRSIEICFDNDFDHPMESVLMGHPENEMPFCVRTLSILDDQGHLVYKMENNHQTILRIQFDQPLHTAALILKPEHPAAHVPASLFAIRCFNS